MFGLETYLLILLIISLFAACAFEFVNGFHDTANAVATVIYTHSLPPQIAVIWSGIMNFLGLLISSFFGYKVAMGIINLLPVELMIEQNVNHSLAMVFALLLSAIIWNVSTWWFGLPASSSHTLIGAILGVGVGHSFFSPNQTVNWDKASDIGQALLFSPLFGFGVAMLLVMLLRRLLQGEKGDELFHQPDKTKAPPLWIRGILILTCTLVSFFHGNNDGQKGVGLVMLILIGIVPAYFALNPDFNLNEARTHLTEVRQVLQKPEPGLQGRNLEKLTNARIYADSLQSVLAAPTVEALPKEERLMIRRDIMVVSREVSDLLDDNALAITNEEKERLKSNVGGLREGTDYAPRWVIIMIATALGLGTMVGWRRIVITIGEKIGKNHLTYAQGASSEVVAATTIGLSSGLGLPVSTTHVLSSAIAGSMFASGGVKNLQGKTVRNIALAWIMTLPVTIVLSAGLYLLFRTLFA